MKPLKFILFILLLVTFSSGSAICQNTELERLIVEYRKIKSSQDSLNSLVTQYRQDILENPSKQRELTEKIISIEDQQYSINSQLNSLTSKILAIDPNAAKRLVEGSNSKTDAVEQNATLILNSYFKELLSEKDVSLINSSASVERIFLNDLGELRDAYEKLKSLKLEYDQAKNSAEMDRLQAEVDDCREEIESIDARILRNWTPIYNKKIETYLVVADKIGIDRQQLEQIDEYFRKVRRAEADRNKQIVSNATLFYPQRDLILNYELMLARNMELTLAKDSISSRISSLPKEVVDFPIIEFEYRTFVVYSKIFNDGKYDFSGVESIPELDIPRKGIYYVVQIVTLPNKVKSMTTFKNIRPLHVYQNNGGSYHYVVGGFRKYADAQAALAQVTKWGFRAPAAAILAWVDGVSTPPAKAKAIQEEIDKNHSGRFKIEITTQNSELMANLKAIVDKYTEDKQVTRAVQGGKIIFSVLEFDGQVEAEELADILRRKDKTEVKIIKIEE